MTRVMYFESNRSSEDGMLAVGTTVMNRVQSGKYPRSVCGVVSQPGQFAPGLMTSSRSPRLAARVQRVAQRVLDGERHPQVGGAMFFHTVGYSFPYTNMHYVAVAGGNAFYEKVPRTRPVKMDTMFAQAAPYAPYARSAPRPERPREEPDETVVAENVSMRERPSPIIAAQVRPAPRSIDDLLASFPSSPNPRRKVAQVDWSSVDPGRY